MKKGSAIGIIETSSIAKGFEISDSILTAATVELVVNRTICPGKYMVLISGDVDAVQASIEAGIRTADIAASGAASVGSRAAGDAVVARL